MATITEKKRNGKVVAFKFFHCVGRDEKGKQHFRTTTWKPPENLSYAKAKKMAEVEENTLKWVCSRLLTWAKSIRMIAMNSWKY